MGFAYERTPQGSSTVYYDRSPPVLSSTPILQAQHAPRYPPATNRLSQAQDRGLMVIINTLQQLPRPSITLPALACLLVGLNHMGTLLHFLWSLGLVDCIAITCLLASAILATQHLQLYLRQAAQTIVVQILEMTDSKVLLAKLTEIATLNPAPGNWLNMYYTMVDDIAGLHQENVKMRTIMAGMQADIEHLKSKSKYFHPVRTMYRAVAGDK